MSRARALSITLTAGGGLLVAAGVFLVLGLGFALLVAGALAVAAGLFLVPVDADGPSR